MQLLRLTVPIFTAISNGTIAAVRQPLHDWYLVTILIKSDETIYSGPRNSQSKPESSTKSVGETTLVATSAGVHAVSFKEFCVAVARNITETTPREETISYQRESRAFPVGLPGTEF